MALNVVRNIFLEQVIKQVEAGEDIVLVTADFAAPILDGFREKYPERYVSVGIAEQNLISVAAGIALEGKKVIAYTANPFMITRAYDQIRNLISVMNVPLCMVGVGAGFHIPEYGATHCVTDDLALVRMCPGIEIYNVSDLSLASWLGKSFLSFEKPVYIRFDRVTDRTVTETIHDVKQGYRVLNRGGDKAIVTTGNLGTEYWEKHRDEIIQKNITYVDVFKFPFNRESFLNEIEGCSKVITVDESNSINGFGQQIIELLHNGGMKNTVVIQKAIEYADAFPNYFGSREFMLEKYGLRWEDIVAEC